MRRGTILLLPVLVAALALPAQAAPPLPLRALTRIASKLSGLQAQRKVKVVYLRPKAMDRRTLALFDRDYPAARQAYDESIYRLLGLMSAGQRLRPTLVELYGHGAVALYDPRARLLFVRRGRDARAAVLHELVHALQDQAFDLRRLSSLRRGQRDAALAAAAAVEGHAVLSTRVLGGRLVFAARAPASHSGSHLRAFLDLERRFPATTGVRFVAALRNLGGNAAVVSALRRFPQTTEQIFHLDAFLGREAPAVIATPEHVASFDRIGEDTFGELDVRALLAVNQVPRLDHAGEGWAGGRTALYAERGGARALLLALRWETETDAAEWADAAATLVNEAFDADRPGQPATVPCGADTCWFLAGRAIAFRRVGSRTAFAIAPTIPGADALVARAAP